METTDDLVTSAGDPGSDRPPALNTKAGRARLYRERRKHDLSVEQLEDARKKNRCPRTPVIERRPAICWKRRDNMLLSLADLPCSTRHRSIEYKEKRMYCVSCLCDIRC